jgi:hypothetical protein
LNVYQSCVDKVSRYAARLDNLLAPQHDVGAEGLSAVLDELHPLHERTGGSTAARHKLRATSADGVIQSFRPAAVNGLDPAAIDCSVAGKPTGHDELGTVVDYIAKGFADDEIEAALAVDCGPAREAPRPHDLDTAIDDRELGRPKYDLVAVAVDGRGYCGPGDESGGFPFNDFIAAVYNGVRRNTVIINKVKAAGINDGEVGEAATHEFVAAGADCRPLATPPASTF